LETGLRQQVIVLKEVQGPVSKGMCNIKSLKRPLEPGHSSKTTQEKQTSRLEDIQNSLPGKPSHVFAQVEAAVKRSEEKTGTYKWWVSVQKYLLAFSI
jgi:hypothetical protein